MKASMPWLLPIFRSQTQGELLSLLYLNPDEEFSLTELAEKTGVTVRAVHHEVSRLVVAGILVDRRRGSSRLVRAAQGSLLTKPLTDLLAVTYGPLPVLTAAFTDLPGAEQVFIYGSWAARYSGEPGEAPGDVDVLVVGDADPDELDDRARSAETVLRREVNVRRVRRPVWEGSQDPFVSTLRARPLVELKVNVHDAEVPA